MKALQTILANAKKKKGFTLVEVIIVLVIIAILAAVLIPSLTGYIDKANEKAAITNARNFTMAAQTIASETYGTGDVSKLDDSGSTFIADAFKLAELDPGNYLASVSMSTKGKINKVIFKDGDYYIVYDGGKFTISTDAADKITANAVSVT